MNKERYKKYLERKINESRNKILKIVNKKLEEEKQKLWKEWESWIDKKRGF